MTGAQEQYYLLWKTQDRKVEFIGLYAGLEGARSAAREEFGTGSTPKGRWRVSEDEGPETWTIPTEAGTYHIRPVDVAG
jgi:hypothetical protein